MMILVDVELNVELHLFFWYFMAASTDINVEGIPPPNMPRISFATYIEQTEQRVPNNNNIAYDQSRRNSNHGSYYSYEGRSFIATT